MLHINIMHDFQHNYVYCDQILKCFHEIELQLVMCKLLRKLLFILWCFLKNDRATYAIYNGECCGSFG